jgi:hypothetical protein
MGEEVGLFCLGGVWCGLGHRDDYRISKTLWGYGKNGLFIKEKLFFRNLKSEGIYPLQ